MNKLNKGEWAEIYVFLRLLADGHLGICDGSLSAVRSSLPLVEIVRQNSRGIEYTYKVNGRNVDICHKGRVAFSVPRSHFSQQAKRLKEEIKTSKGASFCISQETESFLTTLKIDNPKAKSFSTATKDSIYGGKCDIRLSYIEPTSGIVTNTGFSIKSSFGHPATLMNFSSATKFPIRLDGADEGLKNSINSLFSSKGIDLFSRCQAILLSGITPVIQPPKRKNGVSVFEDNLRLINSDLVYILQECVYLSYFDSSLDRRIDALSDYLSSHGSFSLGEFGKVFYPKVLKDFLFAVFGGMTPAKPWGGTIAANGGFIVVNKNWEVMVCLSSDTGSFKDYLFHNTRFEHPSATKKKGDFGYVYKIEDQYYIDLNFSIRFIK